MNARQGSLVTKPPNAPCSAAAPAAITSIDRESIRQKTSDLGRTGRGGQLEHVVRRQPFPGKSSGGSKKARWNAVARNDILLGYPVGK